MQGHVLGLTGLYKQGSSVEPWSEPMQEGKHCQSELWPELPLEAWRDTYQTLHLWTQIIGKIRLGFTPWLNHSWHVALYVSERGLATSLISCGKLTFGMEFDFIDHVLWIRTTQGKYRQVLLRSQPVAEFYVSVVAALRELTILVHINETPSEIQDAIAFGQDRLHASYDPEFANRFWRILLQVHHIFMFFRTSFLGKCSPVHFFWGSFDLAVTRFSGRPAPLLSNAGNPLAAVMREAYSHEVSSAGFWPGSNGVEYAAFYSYAYPEPEGYSSARVSPAAASYNRELGQFVLAYDAVRRAEEPESMLMKFLQSTYEAAANTGNWDRSALECPLGAVSKPRRV
jgi:hypothetical protein